MSTTWTEGKGLGTARTSTYQLVWYPGFPVTQQPHIVGRTKEDKVFIKGAKSPIRDRKGNVIKMLDVLEEEPTQNYARLFIDMSYRREIILPLNALPVFAQEYTPQISNKVTSYSTLAGNTLLTFGQNIRKIGMKVTIVKAGNHWIPPSSALEAFTLLTGSQTKYNGALILYAYDRIKVNSTRKYRVIVENMSQSHRADRNSTVDYDINFLVAMDYSTDEPSDWGKLAPGARVGK